MADPKETFYRQFQATASTLQEQIHQLPSFSAVGGERQDAIEHILAGISRLRSDVADASDFVPAYDQRTYSNAIKSLSELLDETTAKLAPKTRFQFKPRGGAATSHTATSPATQQQDPRRFVPSDNYFGEAEGSGSNTPAAAAASEQQDSLGSLPTFGGKNYNEEISRPTARGVRKPSFSVARDITLSNHRRVHIILPSSASRATSAGTLTNLVGCIVDMSVPTGSSGAPFASLSLKTIYKSLIVAGHVDGAVHITGVNDSVLVIISRQVRIHECENVDLYLHCASHPIIEDCKGMRFAPVPACYTTDKEKEETNQWDQVDDFKWLKAEHSPNWSVLPENERIQDDVWKTTVPGAPGLDVTDILRKIGVLEEWGASLKIKDQEVVQSSVKQ
ncbi:tubulin binding cofactor C-domain-containing protein [Apodospora peruviana]|uniref:Tubulin binding cofactor C-domain-containing protein n=1 Tax=Apodospora peruviana TaxID=516989 RepID=A0AAE0M7L4_9PEZI|nr:tubulin binding cofactor C-domain-containing protein [Apodospora peruviana]